MLTKKAQKPSEEREIHVLEILNKLVPHSSLNMKFGSKYPGSQGKSELYCVIYTHIHTHSGNITQWTISSKKIVKYIDTFF